LNVVRIAGQRLEDDGIPAVGSLGETEPDVDSQDLLHGSSPSDASCEKVVCTDRQRLRCGGPLALIGEYRQVSKFLENLRRR
jgi:hypothetical protein